MDRLTYAKLLLEMPEAAVTLKHLAGQHAQASHGFRFGKTPSLEQARRYRKAGVLRDYLGKARRGNKPEYQPGKGRDKRRSRGVYDVVSETDTENAKVLLTQGVEPSFKPMIADVTEFAPGRGIEREGLYVANDEAFSRGSFGRVRLYATVKRDELKSPQEMSSIGRRDIDDVLRTENGAVTVGKLPKSIFNRVDVYQNGRWESMTPGQFLKSKGVRPNFPKLPAVSTFESYLRKNASSLFLKEDAIQELIREYNRANLDDKLFMAQDAGLA